jgi:hypothetical protein
MNQDEITEISREHPILFDFLKNLFILGLISIAAIYIRETRLNEFIDHYKNNSALVWLSFIFSTVCLTGAQSFLNRKPKGWKLMVLAAIAISSILPLLAIRYGTNAHMERNLIVEFFLIYFPINMGALGLIRTIGDLIG